MRDCNGSLYIEQNQHVRACCAKISRFNQAEMWEGMMANGWGGRRPGAGAPKGNNNRVIHGEYCQIPAELLALPHQEAVMRCSKLVSIFDCPISASPIEYREWFRASGLVGQLSDRYVRQLKRAHRAQFNARMTEAHIAKGNKLKEWRAVRARFGP